jgi:hypothetical protein
MGLSAGLYVIPAEKFARAQQKGSWSRHSWHKCEPWFSLDRTWSEFNDVLEEKPAPLCYAIEGNVRPNPDALDFAFVSPEVVGRLARALEEMPVKEFLDDLARRQGSLWKESDGRLYTRYFEILRTAYRTAADRGAAVGILIC